MKETLLKEKDSKKDLENSDKTALLKNDNKTTQKDKGTKASSARKKSSPKKSTENGKRTSAQHENKSKEEEEEEDMETEELKATEDSPSHKSNSSNTEKQIGEGKRRGMKTVDSPCTPEKAAASSSRSSPGFTPSTVPPLRKTGMHYILIIFS